RPSRSWSLCPYTTRFRSEVQAGRSQPRRPRHHGETEEYRDENDDRCSSKEHFIRRGGCDVFFLDELQDISEGLQAAIPAGLHGAQPILHKTCYLTFAVYRKQRKASDKAEQ